MIFVNRTQNSSENSKPLWKLRFERGSIVRPLSNGDGLWDIQHSMSMVLDTGFHIWFVMTVYYKMRQILLQNAIAMLLQNASGFLLCGSFIAKCDSYYKLPWFYYKMRQLFQNATSITNCDSIDYLKEHT